MAHQMATLKPVTKKTMIHQLNLSGTPLDIGVALGQFGRQAIRQYRLKSPAWQSLQGFKGQPAFLKMTQAIRQQHPEYWQELQGLAQGLELDLEDVLLWNCRGDLWAQTPDGCTTVQLPGEPAVIAHNEDGDPAFRGACAMAQIAIQGKPAFTTFIYPGSLPGHTFSVTEHGLALTVNNLRGHHARAGLPRMVAVRALLDQPDLASAINYLQSTSFAGGFHLTIGQSGTSTLLSVEFHGDQCSAVTVHTASAHANHMTHTAMGLNPQRITASSKQRQARADFLLAKDPLTEPRSILWDTKNPSYPIYRTSPADSDQENTLATAYMEIHPHQVLWQVYERPAEKPVFSLVNHQWARAT
jgi:hypothetical protein